MKIHEIILNFNFVLQIHEGTLCNPNDLPTVRLELKNDKTLCKYSYIISSHMSIINAALLKSIRLLQL
jgi:hypothetical protein